MKPVDSYFVMFILVRKLFSTTPVLSGEFVELDLLELDSCAEWSFNSLNGLLLACQSEQN